MRAGMDYWHKIDVREYDNFAEFIASIDETHPPCLAHANPARARIHLVETGSSKTYADVKFAPNDYIILGSETTGLPAPLMEEYQDRVISIPMVGSARSLNLSVAVGIVLYEALRQNGFMFSG